VLLAVGESQEMSGEAQSRTEVVLPAAQQALVDAVAATGKPIVVILKNGRALALEGSVLEASAILVTWFLGSETGNAIADIVFGTVAPSGRLPVSFPRESGQEPYHYDHQPTGRPAPAGPRQPYKAQYRTSPNEARFAFGHGLTYGRIAYLSLDMGKGRVSDDAPLTVTAKIMNRGGYAAEEVVQLYVRDRTGSITQPVRRLIDFKRVAIGASETVEVPFTIRREALLYVGADLKPTVEPGSFDVWVAPSAAAGLEGGFELVG